VAVARSSSDNSVMRCVLLVLWMSHIFTQWGQNQNEVVSSRSPGGDTGDAVAVYTMPSSLQVKTQLFYKLTKDGLLYSFAD